MSIDIDDLIKKHVNGHEADIDPNDIWEGIMAKRQAAPVKKRRFPYFILLLLLPLAGSVGYWLVASSPDSSSHNMNKSLSGNTMSASEIAVLKADEVPAKKQSLKYENTSDIQISNNTVTNNNTTTQNTIAKTTNGLNTNKNLFPAIITSQSSGSYNPFTQPNLASSPTRNSADNNELNGQIIKDLNVDNQLLAEGIESAILPITSNKKLLTIPSIDLIATDFLTSKKNIPGVASMNIIALPQSLRWSISTLAGYSTILNRSVTYSTFSENEDYRSMNEKALDAISASVLFSYKLCDKVSITSGVAYQKDFVLFDWSGSYVEDNNGMTFTEGESESLPSSFRNSYIGVDRNAKVYNQYEYYDIPLLLNYDMGLSKLRTSFQIGIAANVHHSAEGLMLSESLLPLELSEMNNSLKIGLKYSGAVVVDYPLLGAWNIQGSLGYSTRKTTRSSHTLNYSYLDAKLGLRYDF